MKYNYLCVECFEKEFGISVPRVVKHSSAELCNRCTRVRGCVDMYRYNAITEQLDDIKEDKDMTCEDVEQALQDIINE